MATAICTVTAIRPLRRIDAYTHPLLSQALFTLDVERIHYPVVFLNDRTYTTRTNGPISSPLLSLCRPLGSFRLFLSGGAVFPRALKLRR